MPAPPLTSNIKLMSVTRSLRCCGYGACSMTALGSKAGSTLCVFCSDIEMRWGARRRLVSSRPELDEIGVAKALAVVEN